MIVLRGSFLCIYSSLHQPSPAGLCYSLINLQSLCYPCSSKLFGLFYAKLHIINMLKQDAYGKHHNVGI